MLEGVEQEIARHERPGLDGPLVQIHTRVKMGHQSSYIALAGSEEDFPETAVGLVFS